MPTTTTGLATSFINFSRPGASGGGATVTDRDGKIKWAGHNLLPNSESFDNSTWSKAGVSVTANTYAAPDGATTADTLVFSAGNNVIYRDNLTIPSAFVIGCWVRSTTGTATFRFTYYNGSTSLYSSDFTATTSWQFFSATFTGSGVVGNAGIATASGLGATTIVAWGAHLYRSDMQMQQNPAMGAGMGSYYPTTVRNLLGYTEDFSNAAWGKLNIAAFGSGSVSNAIIAPNGLQTADKIVASTATGYHQVTQSFVVGSGANTLTIYAKAAEYSLLHIAEGSGGRFQVSFNLATGTVVAGSSGPNLSSTNIVSVGDGWYRCVIVMTGVSAGIQIGIIGYPVGATLNVYGAQYTGDGTSGIYLWGAQLSDSASLDTYVPVYGAAVTSAAYYAPRLDFDGATLAAKGLLVEEQRVNVLQHTAALENAAWTKVSSDAATKVASPDGTSSANLVYPTSSTTFVGVRQIIAAGGFTSGVYTISVYAKAAGKNVLGIIDFAGGTGVAAYFTLTGSGTATNGLAGYTQTITPLADGWYRCTMTSTSSWSNAGNLYTWIVVCDAVGSGAVTASGTNGIQMYGVQTELGSFATSYIPNGSATSGATRTADVASVSTQAFPYSASEGTYVAAFQTVFDGTNPIASSIITADTSITKLMAYIGSGANQVSAYDGSTIITRAIDVTGPVSKAASAYNASGRALAVNGSAVATGTVAAGYSSISSVTLGGSTNSGLLNGWIRQFTYIPRRLTDAELTSRSA